MISLAMFLIIFAVLLCGPLRPWARRHWTLLVSLPIGALAGGWLGSYLAARLTNMPFLPLAGALIGAFAAVIEGPAALRRWLNECGGNDHDTRRH
jgi:hypothetical protein